MNRAAETGLVVVVGLTGVGKSTVLDDVMRARPAWRLLPNRRELTDRVILPAVQQHLGIAETAVEDRLERFRLTAAYRDMHPGGMTHALARWLERDVRDEGTRAPSWVFDNLRGLQEVEAAVAEFPGARFCVLDAAPATRLARLVERRDPFDRVAGGDPGLARAGSPVHPAEPLVEERLSRLRAIPDADRVFDVERVAAWAVREDVEPQDLERSARIIVEEQRNYDSTAARRFLAERLPTERFLAVDTDRLSRDDVVRRVLAWPGSAS